MHGDRSTAHGLRGGAKPRGIHHLSTHIDRKKPRLMDTQKQTDTHILNGIGELLSEVGARASGGYSKAEGSGGVAADSTALGSNNVEGDVGETEAAMAMEMASGTKSERAQQSGSREGGGDFALVRHV